MAGSTRQLKFGRLIQKEISDIFQRDRRGILDNAFITVADVKVSPDLQIRKQVRIIPELIFYLDEVEENAQRMDSLINNLNIPSAAKKQEEE